MRPFLSIVGMLLLMAGIPLQATTQSPYSEWIATLPDEDSDADGLTNAEEGISETNPTNPDCDGDGVLDGADGWALSPKLHPKRLPETQYAVFNLNMWGMQGDNADGNILNDDLMILHGTEIPGESAMVWKDGNTYVLPNSFIASSLSQDNTVTGGIYTPFDDDGTMDLGTWRIDVGLTKKPPYRAQFPTDIISEFYQCSGIGVNKDSIYASGQAWANKDSAQYYYKGAFHWTPGGSSEVNDVFKVSYVNSALSYSPFEGTFFHPRKANSLGTVFGQKKHFYHEGPYDSFRTLPGNWSIHKGSYDFEIDANTWLSLRDISEPDENGTEYVSSDNLVENRLGIWISSNGVWQLGYDSNTSKEGILGEASFVNKRCELIGGFTKTNNVSITGSVVRNGRIIDLNSKVSGWTVYPQAINNNGVILADGQKNGEQDWHPVLLVPADIAVDSNRDGTIRFAGNFQSTQGKPTDRTTEAKPFRFWCNDDNDTHNENGGEDVVPVLFPDSEDDEINSLRDLEDFARLYVHIGAFYEEIANGTFKIGLKWRDTNGTAPKIKVYKSTDTAGSDSYLKDDTVAFAQVSGDDAEMIGEVAGSGELILDREGLWSGYSEANPKLCLLFEGSGEGKGQLCITIHKSDGTPLGDGPGVWLDLKDIKKMYQRGKAQPEGIQAPHDNPSGPFSGTISVVPDGDFQKDPSEEKKAVVFVHGWSMTYAAFANYSETMFKRLWHQGFKGRFCSFRWDPLVVNEAQLYAGEYNRSEHRAFLYGEALKQFVETVKQDIPTVSLIGHSMGNIVCGSALQQGLTVKNYLLMEAAVPAGCFDESGGNGSGGVNGYKDFWDEEDINPTPDHHNAEKGYRGFLTGIRANANQVVNFHNRLDFALATGTKFFFFQANWEKNQIDYKPDGSGTAIHASDWRYLYNTNETDPTQKGRLENIHDPSTPVWTLTRYVNDPYETKAFIARPRSKAVGAVDASFGNRPSNMQHVNLQDYGFDGRESDHSGQFNRRIQEADELYREIGVRAGFIQSQ